MSAARRMLALLGLLSRMVKGLYLWFEIEVGRWFQIEMGWWWFEE